VTKLNKKSLITFAGLVLLFAMPKTGSKIYAARAALESWIAAQKNQKPFFLYLNDRENDILFDQLIARYTDQKLKERLGQLFSSRESTLEELRATFNKIPLSHQSGTVGIYLFSPEGVFLYYTPLSHTNPPDHLFLRKMEKYYNDYLGFLKNGRSDYGPLFWLYRCYISNAYRFGYQLTEKINVKTLTAKEKESYIELKGRFERALKDLSHRRISESH